jgi:hypothetical protein
MLLGMPRPPVLSLVAMLVLACADVGTGEDTNPFGDGTAATGTDTGASSPTSGEASTAGTGEATAMPTTEPATTEAPTTAEASTSGPPPDTDDATSTPGDSSDGGSGEGELGDCIGIGAWESCAQYCEANLDVCVEAGCGGVTVVYYGDIEACTAMRGNGEATPCDEGFAMGGGASFARCCCV